MSTQTMNVTLPSSTLYVSGTVNGISTTWTNTKGQTWETVAERSGNDIYVVALTIINSEGVATEATFTLYYGLHLITDRTQADVDYVEQLAAKIQAGTVTERELTEWNTMTLKGSYNHTDFNRVGAAMQYVADRLEEHGYVVIISPKMDWREEDCPGWEDTEHYLSALALLRSAFAVLQSTPEVPPDMEKLTYVEANNIEKILEDIDCLLTNAARAWFYSGEAFSGEV